MHSSLFEEAAYGVEGALQYPKIVFVVILCVSVRKLLSYAQSTVQTSSLLSSGGFVTHVGAKVLNSCT